MLKILLLAGVACILCRWVTKKWPWEYLGFGHSAHQQAVSRARAVLGVKPGVDQAQIIAAHKRLVSQVHPDRGGTNAAVHEANAARDILLEALPKEGMRSE